MPPVIGPDRERAWQCPAAGRTILARGLPHSRRRRRDLTSREDRDWLPGDSRTAAPPRTRSAALSSERSASSGVNIRRRHIYSSPSAAARWGGQEELCVRRYSGGACVDQRGERSSRPDA